MRLRGPVGQPKNNRDAIEPIFSEHARDVLNEKNSGSVREQATLACYNGCGYTPGMVLELKLRKVGNSVGVVLPKEAMAKLNVHEGDTLALTDGPDGSMRVTPVTEGSAQFAKQMKAAEKIIRRYRNTLRELAK